MQQFCISEITQLTPVISSTDDIARSAPPPLADAAAVEPKPDIGPMEYAPPLERQERQDVVDFKTPFGDSPVPVP